MVARVATSNRTTEGREAMADNKADMAAASKAATTKVVASSPKAPTPQEETGE